MASRFSCRMACVGVALASLCVFAGERKFEYLVGGPLAGVKLPLAPTQHGEPAGHPGCIPALAADGEAVEDMGNQYREWGPQGLAPERELYPGSVEHYRAYMFKYMPIRSSFDAQSQLRNWAAASLPGVDATQIQEYAAPVFWVPRHAAVRDTGAKLKPVRVVRCKIGAPVLKLDLGALDVGLYAVRVIAAVEAAQCRPFREPAYLRMSVNDGLQGETSSHRVRIGYCEEFYSVAEFYFHAVEKRQFHAELALDRGSKAELLVHNITLDDVLAGTERRAVKNRTTLKSGQKLAEEVLEKRREEGHTIRPTLPRKERLARDATIWMRFPATNSQASSSFRGGWGSVKGVAEGTAEFSPKAIEEKHGKWTPINMGRPPKNLPKMVNPSDVILFNAKLGLAYTHDDLRHHRPLPDPYPVKDDGAGLFFPDPQNPSEGKVWCPIAQRVGTFYREYYGRAGAGLKAWKHKGEYDDAHDAAIGLVRWAYAFPTLDYANWITSVVHNVGPFGRDYRCRRRETVAFFMPHYPMYVKPIMYHYDELYDFIKGNQSVADSVSRFVPWVKTPQDVIKLIDVYLVQTTAKRILRYHYHTDPMDIANLAAIVGDPKVTDPWMDWLFSRTFIYPLPTAGIQDAMISGTCRDGGEYIGSSYYVQGENAVRVAASLEQYLDAGGNRKYDLTDPKRYPKAIAHVYYRLGNTVCGWDFPRIGDVCGPDKYYGHTLRDLNFARHGWKWTKDPKFAFIIRHYIGRKHGETDKEWRDIEKAAATVPRAPWLEARSRMMPYWAAVLETGHQHDDVRFRRAAYLRIGYGQGHHHDDGLDLQVVAHGQAATIDGGQRPGYSTPGDRSTKLHNTCQIDDASNFIYSHATALSDHPGARYTAAAGVPPGKGTLLHRQIALIDVDEGIGSQRLPVAQQRPGARLPQGVTPANSYVFDVFRVAGGRLHTYNFHATINDDFRWNATGVAPVKPESANLGGVLSPAAYLGSFGRMPEVKEHGTAPDTFQVDWRQRRFKAPGNKGLLFAGTEKHFLGRNFDESAPRRFTRLTMLGVGGCPVMKAEAVCTKWNYHYTCAFLARTAEAEGLESAFVAIIEPYIGKPFITTQRLIQIPDNENDARRAVAVVVETVNGHVDVNFADGRPKKTRDFACEGARLRIAAEHALYSTDEHGFRLAAITGGTLLEAPEVKLELASRRHTGRVVKVDYLARSLWIDRPWPARESESIFEVGVPKTSHMTAYTAVRVAPDKDGELTRVTVQRGADYYRSEVVEVDEQTGVVTCVLEPMMRYVQGIYAGRVASNEACTQFWRAEYLGERWFRLAGAPVTKEAFGKEGVLRLWEYGVGDRLHQPTTASLRRVAPGEYEFRGNVAAVVALRVTEVEVATAGQQWRRAEAIRRDGWLRLAIAESMAIDKPLRLRVK